jgi:hypothetical protein
MILKINRNKIFDAVIGCAIIAGAGGYALADQASRPSVPAISSSMTSTAVSQIFSASVTSKMEVSSKMNDSSTATHVAAKAPASEPAKVSNSADETSIKPNVIYYDIVDPDTGKYINARDPKYFGIKKALGGDAGIVPPDKSSTCAPIIKEWNQKKHSVLDDMKAKQPAAAQAPIK